MECPSIFRSSSLETRPGGFWASDLRKLPLPFKSWHLKKKTQEDSDEDSKSNMTISDGVHDTHVLQVLTEQMERDRKCADDLVETQKVSNRL